MPKYYCEYCKIYLTHDTNKVRRDHNSGWKHALQVKNHYTLHTDQQELQWALEDIYREYAARGLPPPAPPGVNVVLAPVKGSGAMGFTPNVPLNMSGSVSKEGSLSVHNSASMPHSMSMSNSASMPHSMSLSGSGNMPFPPSMQFPPNMQFLPNMPFPPSMPFPPNMPLPPNMQYPPNMPLPPNFQFPPNMSFPPNFPHPTNFPPPPPPPK